MSSFIAYSRPRGIVGNYTVGIFLDLAKTETAKVTVLRNRCEKPCKCCGLQTPNNVTQIFDLNMSMSQHQERILEIYRVSTMLISDYIIIEIRDSAVVPYQKTVFQAKKKGTPMGGANNTFFPHIVNANLPEPHEQFDGFLQEDKRFILNGVDYGTVVLNPILLVDWDKQMFEDDTENKRVEDVLFPSN